MKKWRLIGGITLVFALGVLSGALGTQYYHNQRIEHIRKEPAERRNAFLEKLTGELGLTGDQQKEFRLILVDLDKKREAYDQVKRAEIRKIFDESFALMREKLNPDQQRKLNEMRARYRERRKDKQ